MLPTILKVLKKVLKKKKVFVIICIITWLNGDINGDGLLTYNGEEIGYLYKDVDDGGQVRVKNPSGKEFAKNKGDNRDGYFLHPNNKSEKFSRDNMEKMVSNHRYLASAITKERVKDRVDSSQGDYFKDKALKSDFTQYELDIMSYDANSETHEAMYKSRKDASKIIQLSMQESQIFSDKDKSGGVQLKASDFLVNGQFSWPKDYMASTEIRKQVHESYRDAMDKAYSEKSMNNYMVGAGTRMRKDMEAYNLDMKDLSMGSPALDVRNYLNIARSSSSDGDVNALNVNTEGFDEDINETDLLNGLFEGEYDIAKVSFNPIAGVDPTTVGGGNSGGTPTISKTGNLTFEGGGNGRNNTQTVDWSRVTFELKGGRKVTVDLNNSINKRSTLLDKSENTQKGNALNIIGKYNYQQPKSLSHLRDGDPVTINRKSQDELSVTGSIWTWDAEAGKGAYLDIQDNYITKLAGHPILQSPEGLENMLDALYAESNAQYKLHVKPAKL